MTSEEAKGNLRHAIRWNDMPKKEALDVAIKALETLEEFEKAQIITGGRLNGRTYAYKCGLEDGKRKALEQEPCEDEYIKVPKKALKYRTARMIAYNAEWLKNHFDIERAVICGAQEPKTGRWIYGEDNSGTGRDGWYCNQCGHFEFWDYSSDMKSAELNLPNLCPNCKAKMQEVEE